MQSVHIRQLLRPSRYAFLVNDGDRDQTLTAASLNAALWGGIFNPIIPVEHEVLRDRLLDVFDPDRLVVLCDHRIPETITNRFVSRIDSRTDLVGNDTSLNRKILRLGFNILPILKHAHEKDVRFSRAPFGALADSSADEGWGDYCAFAFGSFDRVPELASEFTRAYRSYLAAIDVRVPQFMKENAAIDPIFPLDFTKYDLTVGWGGIYASRPSIFVGDHRNLSHLVQFWNIRATGDNITFLPIESHEQFLPHIKRAVFRSADPAAESIDGPLWATIAEGADEKGTRAVSDWLHGLGLIVAQPGSRDLLDPLLMYSVSSAEGEEVSILQDGYITPAKIVVPPYFGNTSPGFGRYSWSVELDLYNGLRDPEFMFSFPKNDQVDKVVQRSFFMGPEEVRIGRRGIVLERKWADPMLRLAPVRTKNVVGALFSQVGLRVETSEPGQYAERIIEKMGSLHGGCRLLKICGVRAILQQLGTGSTLTQGNMFHIVTEGSHGLCGDHWRRDLYSDLILRAGQRPPPNFSTIFSTLLEKQVIRPGLILKCASCRKEDWYHVSEFNETHTCRYCFSVQRVNFASKHEWHYKSDGLFQLADGAQGSVGVILALWRFEHFLDGRGAYVTSQNVYRGSGGSERIMEIDYVCIVSEPSDGDYELVLGQAKALGELTDEDMVRIKGVSDRFARTPYLAFSTLRRSFSEEDQKRLRALSDEGYRVIALTREELDPYDLFQRFQSAPHQYTHKLSELSENTLRLNVANREETT